MFYWLVLILCFMGIVFGFFHLRFIIVILSLVVLFNVPGKLKKPSKTGTVMESDMEFHYAGKGDDFKDHILFLTNGVIDKGQPADVRYRVSIGSQPKLTYEESTQKLVIENDKCLCQIERAGRVITPYRKQSLYLTIFVTHEEAVKIASILEGRIRGLNGSSSGRTMRYLFDSEEDGWENDSPDHSGNAVPEEEQKLTGNRNDWYYHSQKFYTEALHANPGYQTVKIVSKLFIPIAIAAFLLEIAFHFFIMNGDGELNLSGMVIGLLVQISILPLLLLSVDGGPMPYPFLVSIHITKEGLRGMYMPTVSSDDDDSEEMLVREKRHVVLRMHFPEIRNIDYDPDRGNLRFEGKITLSTENAYTAAGREKPEVETRDSFVLYDYFTPPLADTLKAEGMKLRIDDVEEDYSKVGDKIVRNAFIFLIAIFFLQLIELRCRSMYATLLAAALLLIVSLIKRPGRVKKMKQPFES